MIETTFLVYQKDLNKKKVTLEFSIFLCFTFSPLLRKEAMTYKVNLLIKRNAREISQVSFHLLTLLFFATIESLAQPFQNHFIVEIASDMLKFSICFIVFISHINDSIANREKRFLIFPRGNPTRHQVAFIFLCVLDNRIKSCCFTVHRWNWCSR
jgi:hypothetical protein